MTEEKLDTKTNNAEVEAWIIEEKKTTKEPLELNLKLWKESPESDL